MTGWKKMKSKNTMEKKEYVCENVFWIFLALAFYKKILYIDFKDPKPVCPAFLFSFIMILLYECAIGIHYQRNNWNICKNIIFMYSTSIFFIYYPVYKKIFKIICIIMSATSAACTILIMGRKVNRYKKRAVIRKRRIRKSMETVRFICSFWMSFIMIIPCMPVVFGTRTVSRLFQSENQNTVSGGQTILSNIESVCRLDVTTWKKLAFNEKLDVLHSVIKIEQENLGLPDDLQIDVCKMTEDLLGRYNDYSKQILINDNLFLDETSDELLDTVCHEAYHSYQHRLISIYIDMDEKDKNLKLFRNIGRYENEFRNYKNGFDDFDSYYTQTCENNARKYAEERVKEYYKEINAYLNSVRD